MRKTALCLAFVPLPSCAPAALAEGGDGMTLTDAEGREVFSRPYRYTAFINYDLPDFGHKVPISDGERPFGGDRFCPRRGHRL